MDENFVMAYQLTWDEVLNFINDLKEEDLLEGKEIKFIEVTRDNEMKLRQVDEYEYGQLLGSLDTYTYLQYNMLGQIKDVKAMIKDKFTRGLPTEEIASRLANRHTKNIKSTQWFLDKNYQLYEAINRDMPVNIDNELASLRS